MPRAFARNGEHCAVGGNAGAANQDLRRNRSASVSQNALIATNATINRSAITIWMIEKFGASCATKTAAIAAARNMIGRMSKLSTTVSRLGDFSGSI